jgi:hypothetical protein
MAVLKKILKNGLCQVPILLQANSLDYRSATYVSMIARYDTVNYVVLRETYYFVLHFGYFMAVYGNKNIEFSIFLLPTILDCYRFE